VATIDVHSRMNWVRKALHHSALVTEFEITSVTQSTFPPGLCNQVCALLPTLAPVGVLRLLISLLVPVKGRSFTGGVLFGEVAFQAEGSCIREWQDGSYFGTGGYGTFDLHHIDRRSNGYFVWVG
jgi:hypothetical protein